MVLHIEKATPPDRTLLLEAAAAAVIAVCLDPRAVEPDGEWHEEVAAWIFGQIRKVTRRAHGTHWEMVQQVPGVTVRVGAAEARAVVPCRVVDTPREITRLQISGSDLPADSPGPEKWTLLVPGDDPGQAWLERRVVAVRDAGFTEVAPGTVTVIAQLR